MSRIRIWLAKEDWLELMVEGNGIGGVAGPAWTIIALSPAGLLWSFHGTGDQVDGWDSDTHFSVNGEIGVFNP